LFWLSRINEHSSYAGGLLGPMLIIAAGLGLLFVSISLVPLTKVRNVGTGVASSLLNVGQQVSGSIGLAVLGAVVWSAVATGVRSKTISAAAKPAGHLVDRRSAKADHRSRTGGRLLARFPGFRGDRPSGANHRGGHDPRRSRGPFRHGPDGGAFRLRLI
jgi:hypothetical protein